MKNLKLVLYIIVIIYVIATVFLVINQDVVINRFGFGDSINYLINWLLVGLFLFIAEWALQSIHVGKLKKEINRLEKDNLNLKAKLFDQEEERKEVDRSIHSFEGSLEEPEKKKPAEKKKSTGKKGEGEDKK
jgi:hypothetical protein